MKGRTKNEHAEFEKVVFEVAEKAIAAADMPEAAIHCARLQREGHSAEDARRMIGVVLVTTLSSQRRRKSGRSRGLRAELARLPKIGVAPDGRVLDIRGFEFSP